MTYDPFKKLGIPELEDQLPEEDRRKAFRKEVAQIMLEQPKNTMSKRTTVLIPGNNTKQ